VQPLLELQSGGTFVIEKFPDVMMVDGEVVFGATTLLNADACRCHTQHTTTFKTKK
jgi:hypothetical protein